MTDEVQSSRSWPVEQGEADGEGVWLSVGGAAPLLHVQPVTVSRWAKAGRLPHTRTLGGRIRLWSPYIRVLAEVLAATYPEAPPVRPHGGPAERAGPPERSRHANGHVAPQPQRPLPGRLPGHLRWQATKPGTVTCTGDGWKAAVVEAGPGHRATIRFADGRVVSRSDRGEPATLIQCKRWVRDYLARRLHEARLAAARGPSRITEAR